MALINVDVGTGNVSKHPDAPCEDPRELSKNNMILQQISALEASVTDRRIREAVLGTDNGWLKGVNDQITALREQLTK